MKRFFLLLAVLVIFLTAIAAAEELPRFVVRAESRGPVLGPNYYDTVTRSYNPNYVIPGGYGLFVDAFPGEEAIREINDPELPQGGGRPEPVVTYRLKIPLDTETIDFFIEQVDGQFSESKSTGVGALERVSTRRPPSFDNWRWQVQLPEEGIYEVTVKLRNKDGGGPQGTQRITVQDLLVVSIGDSSASGQGNPDVPGKPKGIDADFADWAWNYLKREFTTLTRAAGAKIDMNPAPIWLEPKAYRSLQSGPALAAKRLDSNAPGRVVTFLSFARSGSEIVDGLIGPRAHEGNVPKELLEQCFNKLKWFYISTPSGSDLLMTSCTSVIKEVSKNANVAPQKLCLGVPPLGLPPLGLPPLGLPLESDLLSMCYTVAEEVLAALQEENIGPIPKVPDDAWIGNLGQIEEAKNTLGDRRIDALLINIGVNDVGMSGTLKDMVVNDFGVFAIKDDAVERRKIRRRIDERLSELPALFGRLDKALETLNVRHVYLVEYPTGLFDQKDGEPAKGCEIFTSFLDLDLTKGDATIVKEVAEELNAILKTEAEKRGWFYISGIAERFNGHGYCMPAQSDGRYFVQAEESLVLQGDTEGTIHPNGLGHQVYAEQIAASVEENTMKVKECSSPTEALCLWLISD